MQQIIVHDELLAHNGKHRKLKIESFNGSYSQIKY